MDNSDQKQDPIEGTPEDHVDGSADMTGSSAHRVVVCVGRDLASECAEVLEVMTSKNSPPVIFSNANASSSVEILRSEVAPITRDRVAVLAAEQCDFRMQLKDGRRKPTCPPTKLIGVVADALPNRLPILRGIKTAPFFYNGSLVGLESGYHEESGFFCRHSRGFDTSLKPDECVDRLEDLLGEFPYESPADRANALGMLVGRVLKADWVSPIFTVDKPASQTGASKLCQTVAALADGLPIATLTQGGTADETDKRVITKLATKHSDRQPFGNFANDIIASGLTSPYTGARKLGGHAEASVSTLALQWYVSGVNAFMCKDLVNRALSVRLNAKMEHPEERTGFRHKLPQDALAHREYYFSAALSMVQTWIDAGCPSGTTTVLNQSRGEMRRVMG